MQKRVAGALLAAVLGCGGGGGGGGGGSRASLVDVDPTSLQGKQYVGYRSPDGQFTLTFGGDLQWLYQQQLFILVLTSDPVFQEQVYLGEGADPATQLLVHLYGVDGLPEGVHTGTLEVHACLDDQCKTELGGSPRTMSYSFEMMHGVRLSHSPVTVSVPFGTVPDPERVAITLPEGATWWTLMEPPTPSPGVLYLAEQASDGSAAVDITYPLVPRGHYTSANSVYTYAPNPMGGSNNEALSEPLDITYDVTDNPGVLVAVWPRELSYHASKAACAGNLTRTVQVGKQDPTDHTPPSQSISDMSAPAGAEGAVWLSLDAQAIGQYTLYPCSVPVGTYQARIAFTADGGGTTYSAEHTVDLVVDP